MNLPSRTNSWIGYIIVLGGWSSSLAHPFRFGLFESNPLDRQTMPPMLQVPLQANELQDAAGWVEPAVLVGRAEPTDIPSKCMAEHGLPFSGRYCAQDAIGEWYDNCSDGYKVKTIDDRCPVQHVCQALPKDRDGHGHIRCVAGSQYSFYSAAAAADGHSDDDDFGNGAEGFSSSSGTSPEYKPPIDEGQDAPRTRSGRMSGGNVYTYYRSIGPSDTQGSVTIGEPQPTGPFTVNAFVQALGTTLIVPTTNGLTGVLRGHEHEETVCGETQDQSELLALKWQQTTSHGRCVPAGVFELQRTDVLDFLSLQLGSSWMHTAKLVLVVQLISALPVSYRLRAVTTGGQLVRA